MHCLRFEAHLR